MWLYVLAPLIANTGLSVMFSYIGWTSAADKLANSNWLIFVVASLFNFVGFLFVVFGIRIFAITQKFVMFFSIGGAIVIGLVFTFTSKATFIANWNAAADATQSPRYAEFIKQIGDAAGQAMPTDAGAGGRPFGTMVVMSWLFAYAYSISFIAGEVKRPDKTIIWANVFAIVVPFIFMFWTAIVVNKTTGYQFIQAASWMDNNGAIDTLQHAVRERLHLARRLLPRGQLGGARRLRQGAGRLDGALLHRLHAVVAGALLPGLPAHPLRLGHGPHGARSGSPTSTRASPAR